MRILADQDIGAVRPLFSRYGELLTRPAADINAAALDGVTALLVRSPTRIDEPLLASPAARTLRFVGTATSGCDHIDQEALKARGIRFAAAHGCNAQAVVDYCITCMAVAARSRRQSPFAGSIGVVGAGHTGSALIGRLRALGAEVVACDPPLARTAPGDFVSLEEALACDTVSLHVPLRRHGDHPTAGLIDRAALAAMGDEALLINSCRGEVVDEKALTAHLRARPGFAYCADVWRNEPNADGKLVEAALLATPHIAGFSQRARRQAAWLLARELARAFPEIPDPIPGTDRAVARIMPWPGGSAWELPPLILPLVKLASAMAVASRRQRQLLRQFRLGREALADRLEFGELAFSGVPPEEQTVARGLGFAPAD